MNKISIKPAELDCLWAIYHISGDKKVPERIKQLALNSPSQIIRNIIRNIYNEKMEDKI